MSATFTPPLSGQIADAIRRDDMDGIANVSPYAACLMPLLNALGWRTYANDLIEALPHFADHFDLVDLRNLLVILGYESDATEISAEDIADDLLPCLFLSSHGGIFVIKERDGNYVRYYDAKNHQDCKGPLRLRGTAYVFTDANATHAVSIKPTADWFPQLLSRFRSFIKHLLAMTALLNVLALAVPLFIMTVYDKVIGTGTADALPFLAGGIVLVLAVELGLRLLRARTLGLMAGRLDYIIGVETFRQLIYMPPLMTERSSIAAQLSTLKQFDAVRDFFTGSTAAMVLEAPFVLLFIVVIWLLAGWVAVIPLGMLGLYAVFAVLWLPTMNEKVMLAGSARTARQHMLMETMAGLRELKGLGAESVWRERFRETAADTLTALYKTATSQAVLESVTHSLMTLSGVAVLAVGTMKAMQGDITIGALIAIMALLWRVLGPIQGLFLAYVKFDQIFAGIKTINQLMKIKVERTSGKSALLSPKLEGAVRFDRLSFKYSPNSDPALLGVSFSVKPKEFVAILGDNASGKSTLLKLIAGMYTAQSGSLHLDDIDTRQFNPIDIRRLVAYVPQNPILFHGTIAQNLRFKNVVATDEELEIAAARAGILDTIHEMPNGFDSRIGDNATDRLPSGLVHGLCLARAFVRPAPLLLLDEPGASLDRGSDSVLIEQLLKIRGERTIVLISHRPSHIKLADKAILLNAGMVRFEGPPEEALAIMQGKTLRAYKQNSGVAHRVSHCVSETAITLDLRGHVRCNPRK